MQLYETGGALDLMLRGYNRDAVLARTGVDIGYNGRSLRDEAAGVDRVAYKIAHVRERVDTNGREEALRRVCDGCPRDDVLAVLGLSGPHLITLKALFEGVGLGEEFAAARAKARAESLREGMVAAHGVEHGFESSQVQERSAQVRKERYGAAYTLDSLSVLAAGARARIARVHEIEDTVVDVERVDVYRRLVEQFGVDDVRVNHDDGRYGFECAFYVSSRELFVEMIASWSLAEDRRVAAEKAGLNLVVFRESVRGHDFDLWCALGCPDGVDWREDYSWIGQRVADDLQFDVSWPEALTGSVGISRRAARAANGEVFYTRELALWRENPQTSMGSLRGRLICNRHHYLGKLPDELTDNELLRGMRISGLVRGYTAFDNSGMVTLIDRYGVSSVFDPCAGWGERLATCAGHGVRYLGVDVNEAVVRGHQDMVACYGLTDQTTMVAHAEQFDARGMTHDMVFTCPPYGSVEIYTAQGAENLGSEDFLAWWSQVVEMSVGAETTVFAYQINQALRESMNDVVAGHGWRLVDQIDVGRKTVSHFNKNSDGTSRRREFEQVQVFERVR